MTAHNWAWIHIVSFIITTYLIILIIAVVCEAVSELCNDDNQALVLEQIAAKTSMDCLDDMRRLERRIDAHGFVGGAIKGDNSIRDNAALVRTQLRAMK